MATTLAQYYKEKGLTLPSVAERASIASKAGITNYSGKFGQNQQLLDYLQGQGAYAATTPVAPAAIVPNIKTPSAITQAGTDISAVDDVAIVPTPAINAPAIPTPTLTKAPVAPTVLRSIQNADGSITQFFSDGTSQKGINTRNSDGTTAFAPLSGDPLLDRITITENEIRTIEDRMANRSADRTTRLSEAGVFDDLRRLNELNATLRAAQDRQIEIPIESRQRLRGRGATIAELGQESAPELEKAVLSELVASRQSARLTDSIQTNIAEVDNYIKAETDRDNVIFNQKNRYLTQLQTQYGNILTAKQQLALEDRKYQNEREKEQRDWDRQLKQKNLDAAIAAGASPEQIQAIINGTASDAIALNAQLTGNIRADSAQSVVSQIDKILTSPGKDGAVGTNFLGRISISGDAQTFKGLVDQFTSQATLDAISDLKAKGVSLGALSDSELQILAGSVLPIRRNSNGAVTMKEEAFENVMNTVKSAAQKTFIASKIGKSAYDTANYKNAPQEVINAKYQELVNAQAPAASAYSSDFEISMTPGNAGNLPQRNNNPGNVKKGGLADSLAIGTDSQGHLIFPSPVEGFQALALDLSAKINGKSRYLPANPTIAQLGKVYAEDGGWANSVSKILGVPVTTPTATIPLEKLLAAVARQEGYFARA